jgi:DNA-binding transcriptional LysR family regulator
MKRIDTLNLAHPFAGSRMLRDMLNREGFDVGRRHVATLMRRMSIEALYRKPNTSKKHPTHKVFVCPAKHPLLSAGPLPVGALEGMPFIVREPGSGTRDAMEVLFSERRFVPRITMDMASNETIKQAVIAGMGLSFLSLHTVGLDVRSGLLGVLEIEGTPVMRTWNVVRPQSKVLSPGAEAFRYFILEEGEPYLVRHDTELLSGRKH